MRVIIWGINYAPEPTGISPYTTDLAEFFQTRDIDVEVITGFAYYPSWQKQRGDRGVLYRREKIGDVQVNRCWQYVPRKLNTIKRVLHEVSFGLSSLLRAVVLPRADVYVVISPPLGLGVLAWFVTKLKRSKFLFHVQDLQPDSAAGLGMVKAGLFLRMMYACERFAYAKAAAVSGISRGMVDAFIAKQVDGSKVCLLPNWLRQTNQTAPSPIEVKQFRQTYQIAPEALLAVYSGNLGRKQGLDALVDAAELLNVANPTKRQVMLIIAGDGADQAALAQRLKAHPLPNLRLLPLLPSREYQVMLRAADVALVTQMPGTGQVCFPSKLLSVLSAGLPVVTAADDTSDLARAVAEGKFGVNVPAASPTALAKALAEIAERPAMLQKWRESTRWVERFSPDVMLPKFEQAVRALVAPEKSPVYASEVVSRTIIRNEPATGRDFVGH